MENIKDINLSTKVLNLRRAIYLHSVHLVELASELEGLSVELLDEENEDSLVVSSEVMDFALSKIAEISIYSNDVVSDLDSTIKDIQLEVLVERAGGKEKLLEMLGGAKGSDLGVDTKASEVEVAASVKKGKKVKNS